jgi:hypothetical protein
MYDEVLGSSNGGALARKWHGRGTLHAGPWERRSRIGDSGGRGLGTVGSDKASAQAPGALTKFYGRRERACPPTPRKSRVVSTVRQIRPVGAEMVTRTRRSHGRRSTVHVVVVDPGHGGERAEVGIGSRSVSFGQEEEQWRSRSHTQSNPACDVGKWRSGPQRFRPRCQVGTYSFYLFLLSFLFCIFYFILVQVSKFQIWFGHKFICKIQGTWHKMQVTFILYVNYLFRQMLPKYVVHTQICILRINCSYSVIESQFQYPMFITHLF